MLAEVDNWDLRVHIRESTRVQNRRNVEVGVLVPSRHFGQTTNLLSQYLVIEGGDSHVSWTQLATEVWEVCWKHELSREGVQVGTRKYEEYRGLCFHTGDYALVVDV